MLIAGQADPLILLLQGPIAADDANNTDSFRQHHCLKNQTDRFDRKPTNQTDSADDKVVA